MLRVKAGDLTEKYEGRRVSFTLGDTRIIGKLTCAENTDHGIYTMVGIENISDLFWLRGHVEVTVFG